MPNVVFTVGTLKYTVVCQHITIWLFLEIAYMIISYVALLSEYSAFVYMILHNLYEVKKKQKRSSLTSCDYSKNDEKSSYQTRLHVSRLASCLRQHPVVGASGEGIWYLWLNVLAAQLASYLPVSALSWHMPWSMRLYFPNLMLSYLILDYQFLKPQGRSWLSELYCK